MTLTFFVAFVVVTVSTQIEMNYIYESILKVFKSVLPVSSLAVATTTTVTMMATVTKPAVTAIAIFTAIDSDRVLLS